MTGIAPGSPDGIVYIRRSGGHRDSYLRLLSGLLGLEPRSGDLAFKQFREFVAARRVFFATVDDGYLGFIIVAIVRAAFGRSTVALFLRPQTCFDDRALQHVKRWVFGVLRRIPGISILTIVPFALRPRYAEVANGWVHDPQMWDAIEHAGGHTDDALAKHLRERAAGRKIISFVGAARQAKGFRFLCDLVRQSGDLQSSLFVAVGGVIPPESTSDAQYLEECGMMVEDRFLDDSEILALYDASDLIWCCYRADYDQASGIFGRAIQWQKRPIVRKGAIAADYGALTGVEALELDSADMAASLEALLAAASTVQPPGPPPQDMVKGWRDHFIQTVSDRL